MKSKKRKSRYKLKAKIFRTLGILALAITTIGSFLIYEYKVNWVNFKQDLDNFVLVNEHSVKLNLAIALPFAIVLVVFVIVASKKNKDFFTHRLSLNLLFIIIILYLFYSIVEVTIASLIGAFAGSLIDEFIFSPLSMKYTRLATEKKELDFEYEKEKRRIIARKKAEEELDGSV